MKDKLKSILGNGLPYGLFFFGLSFLLGYYMFHAPLQKTMRMSALIGSAAFVVNGLIYSRFPKSLKRLESIIIKVENQELLLLQAPANHLIQDSLVSGKLLLTDQRLVFKAYEADAGESQIYSWELSRLLPVNFFGSLWNPGGEFLLKTTNDIPLVFEVNGIKQWKKALCSKAKINTIINCQLMKSLTGIGF